MAKTVLVVEDNELNMKLFMVAASMAALVIVSSQRRWWSDALAVALAAYAMFANELGLLVWVCLAAAYLVGCRGASRRTARHSACTTGARRAC